MAGGVRGENTDLASSIGQALCKVPYIYHQWSRVGKKKKKKLSRNPGRQNSKKEGVVNKVKCQRWIKKNTQ